MPLTQCRECGNEVSTEAKTCPRCGVGAPAKTKKGMSKTLKYLLIIMAIGMFANVFLIKRDRMAASSPVASTARAAPDTSPECNIPKKDGSMDERKCDLQELCKDWVFYRKKIMEYSGEGNVVKATDARASFNRVNQWLSAYKESDVSSCITRNGG